MQTRGTGPAQPALHPHGGHAELVGGLLVNQGVFDRVESVLRQVLRTAAEAQGCAAPTAQAQVQASVLVSFVIGRLQRYARSGFKRLPCDQLDAALRLLA